MHVENPFVFFFCLVACFALYVSLLPWDICWYLSLYASEYAIVEIFLFLLAFLPLPLLCFCMLGFGCLDASFLTLSCLDALVPYVFAIWWGNSEGSWSCPVLPYWVALYTFPLFSWPCFCCFFLLAYDGVLLRLDGFGHWFFKFVLLWYSGFWLWADCFRFGLAG